MTALTPEVRDLLTVIRDGLSLPYPADVGDCEKREDLRRGRAICTVATLSFCLDEIDATAEEITRWLRTNLDGYPVEYVIEFKVTARPWARGWELHVQDVGVTQSAPDKASAEAMARDYIAQERDIPLDAFRVVIDTTEVSQ